MTRRADPGEPNRRRFLQGSAAGFALASFPPTSLWAEDLPRLEDYQPEYFLPAEWSFILAAVARLIPSDSKGPGAVEARVPVYIDRQLVSDYGRADDWYMDGPHDAGADPLLGWQSPLSPAELYREAIPIFDGWCQAQFGNGFGALTSDMQDNALRALEEGEAPLPSTSRDFFTLLLANTKEGYFADPLYGGNHGMQSWVYIGFPGSRANFREWLDRPGVPYRLGPVSISGERA